MLLKMTAYIRLAIIKTLTAEEWGSKKKSHYSQAAKLKRASWAAILKQ